VPTASSAARKRSLSSMQPAVFAIEKATKRDIGALCAAVRRSSENCMSRLVIDDYSRSITGRYSSACSVALDQTAASSSSRTVGLKFRISRTMASSSSPIIARSSPAVAGNGLIGCVYSCARLAVISGAPTMRRRLRLRRSGCPSRVAGMSQSRSGRDAKLRFTSSTAGDDRCGVGLAHDVSHKAGHRVMQSSAGTSQRLPCVLLPAPRERPRQ
jgi:hypothetical protein